LELIGKTKKKPPKNKNSLKANTNKRRDVGTE
jgi:hypothetical protein